MTKPTDILRDLVLNRPACLAWPHVARALILARRCFPDPVHREIARALLVTDNYREAARFLQRKNLIPLEKVRAFETWAWKLTRRPVRGLLGWPGGVA